ncbi:MAG: UvrD-helicase domain-containing protein, partial [Thermoleophilia bacterium]|nr:UvrD-helicase domain-containing protein [Thermoleophilia bacterium]
MHSPAAPDTTEILADLNEAQLAAVTHIKGPLLVVAGAGSGKTRVLTRRIAYILASRDEEGRPLAYPSQILAITFTNKAAAEMRERVEQIVGPDARRMWVMTFHSACGRILRKEAERLGFTSNFTIYDQGDQVRLVKQCIESLDLDVKRFIPANVHHQISDAKNRLISTTEYRSSVDSFLQETIADIYDLYETRLKASNAMDFDDMIFKVVTLLESDEEVRKHWQARFHYVLVDEYQDTNHAQYRLLRALAGAHNNICCVGDADQSIYSWRGADIRNITSFEDDYPDATVVVLDVNYRSTGHILEAANGIISNNSQRIKKDLKSIFGDGHQVEVLEVDDEHAEAR